MSDEKQLPFLIGIHGAIGAGKDTAANFLSNLLNAPTYAFAAPMRAAASHVFGVTVDELSTQEGKLKVYEPWGLSGRDMLRKMGNEMTKPTLGDDHWIKRAEQVLTDRGFTLAIISDVRFDYEAEWVRKNGFVLHVKKHDNPLAGQMSTHPSDAGISFEPGDFEINNDSDFTDFYDRLFCMITGRSETREVLNTVRFGAGQ